MNTFIASLSILTNKSILLYILGGILFTVIISVIAVGVGVIQGSILALMRNYCNSTKTVIFKWISIAYIEVFRNTPSLLWIFICLVFFPVPDVISKKMFGLSSVEVKILFKGTMALILFTSSVIAEIVRGGLNSIPHGQFEAGFSQGFNIFQIIFYIILPQAYRNIIPTLLSQVITTIKDSSYLASIAVIELTARLKTLLSSAYLYNGTGKVNVSDVFVIFGFAAIIYFIINFSLSSLVRRLQKNPKITRIIIKEKKEKALKTSEFIAQN